MARRCRSHCRRVPSVGGEYGAGYEGDIPFSTRARARHEYVFPPGFKGEEHVAPVNEFAYVLEGEFAVVTKGKGKTVVKKGQVEYAAKGTVHYSVNETKRPARVLVVLLKER